MQQQQQHQPSTIERKINAHAYSILSGEFMINVTHGFTWHLHTTATTDNTQLTHFNTLNPMVQCKKNKNRKEKNTINKN